MPACTSQSSRRPRGCGGGAAAGAGAGSVGDCAGPRPSTAAGFVLVSRFANIMTYFRRRADRLVGGDADTDAEGEPVSHRVDSCGAEGTRSPRGAIYAVVPRGRPRQDHSVRRAGPENEAIARRLDLQRQVVSKWRKRFWRHRLPGLEELRRGGAAGPLFPPESSSPSKPSPVSCPRNAAGHWRTGRCRNCSAR